MKNIIPNILSGFRIIAAPFLLYFAWMGYQNLFIGLLLISLSTDAIDGYIARRLNFTSDIGTKLDSWGDLATYITVPFCAWWLWPEMLKKEAFYVFIVIGAYVMPIIAGLIKFQRLPSYHTWGAKIAAVIMSVGVLILFVTGINWPFRCAAVVQAIVACEEVLITIKLSELQGNVHSLWHIKTIQSKNIIKKTTT
jgi:CDP-diacylglycerol--glycerol-3-phosphate 3-phosphatidyltransferase